MFKAIDPHQSVLPMGSLNAVVLDMETTGLDTTSDHIVQIGAVRLISGQIDRGNVFDELVNPGLPIPEDVTAIHGIGDKDVAGAADFTATMPTFADWVGGRVVLGYSIGFDLAMLKTEHERAGLSWKRPYGLDIAHLVQLLAPALPSTSLDTVAAWLGIEIRDRHQALGDALLAAEIYLALLPKLRSKGIFTLAEAERACLALTAKVDDEARAGWHEPVASKKPDTPERRISRAQVDSFPYKYRLREIMRSPPVILACHTSVRDVLHRMMKEQASSVFLQPDQDDDDFAILTERDVLRALDSQGADALDQPASAFASRPLVTLDGDEFAYRAISRMTGEGFRHLGVRDEAGAIVGAVSARNLLNQRSKDIITLGDHINHARSSAELGRIWSGLASVAATLADEDIDVFDIATIISNELQALTRRACEIAEHEFLESGKGAPPVPYAMLVLGSGGRGESLLSMDQDNAIVYEHGEPGGATDLWFEAFGKRVATILDETGVSYCQGDVMASNASWRMDVAHWRKTVAGWMADSRPENILSADIFFDGRPGSWSAGAGQRAHAGRFSDGSSIPRFPQHAFRACCGVRVTDRMVRRRFKLEEGRVDLKKGGLMALFSTARVLRTFVMASPNTRLASVSWRHAIISTMAKRA